MINDELSWSPEMFRLYTIDPETPPEDIYTSWLARLHPDDRERADAETREFVTSANELSIEFRIIHPQGGERWIHGRGRMHRDPDGRPLRMIGVNFDITGHRRVEENLRESEQRRTEMSERTEHAVLRSDQNQPGAEAMKIAVVQQPPVYLDLARSLERATELVRGAASQGCGMVVFPEDWLPGYPTFVWRLAPGAGMGKTDELYTLSLANSVDLSKDGLRPLQEATSEHGIVVVIGYQEVDGSASGSTLYNSCAIIDADGRIANTHRKLMPTNPERMVWGFGGGSGLNVVDTAVGRVGALICWENYMPLARYALYAQNIDIYVAPTWDSGPTWLATMQHIAREGGCWVVGCATALEVSDIPDDLPYRDELFPNKDEWINAGDAVIYKPFGGAVAGPMHQEKGLLVAEVDVAAARASRRKFDASGHYARPDVFTLTVDRRKQAPVQFG